MGAKPSNAAQTDSNQAEDICPARFFAPSGPANRRLNVAGKKKGRTMNPLTHKTMRNMNTRTKALFGTIIAIVMSAELSLADGVLTYGDKDVLGTRHYSHDPTTGATLLGLQAGQVTFGAPPTFHSYPFDPDPTDYPSTDQIFTGSNQTAFHDGYSGYANRAHGPQVITLDYSSLLPTGSQIETF